MESKLLKDIEKIDNIIKNKKFFIFDFDGTIANTEYLHWKAYNELLKEFNVNLQVEDIQRYMGHSESQIYAMIKSDFSINFDENEFLKKRLQIYLNLVEKENLKPYEFIIEILNKYKEKSTFILVTSQTQSVIEKLLSLWEIDSFFAPNLRFFCNDGKTKKIDIYKDLTKYTNIKNISYKDIVVFEDTQSYITQAKELGISTIGIEHQYNMGKLEACDLIIPTERLILVDGNSIMNRAFYGIMGSKMLMTDDGTYTNAVYGFLAILFKIIDDLKPQYIAVAFDLKAPTARHKMYEGYKANRHGMPEELAAQMPIIKDILRDMNITIIEKEGYEADDILGTLSKTAEKQGVEVTILSGDRDTFQLTSDHITVRIPRTKAGKTEEEDFNRAKVKEVYGLEPIQLIEVKGLQGDTSDNIPGVPGIGEKTALSMVQTYGSIDKIYEELENNRADTIKGKTREKMLENKDLAYLSRTLGTINLEVPIEENIQDLSVKEWNKQKVYEDFKRLKFNRYMERFNLKEGMTASSNNEESMQALEKINIKEIAENEIKSIIDKLIKEEQLIYYLEKEEVSQTDGIIKKKIKSISTLLDNTIYYCKIEHIEILKDIFENSEIRKIGYKLGEDYVLLKEHGITIKNLSFDIEIAAYLLNPTTNQYKLNDLIEQYLGISVEQYLQKQGLSNEKQEQLNLFETNDNSSFEEVKKQENGFKVFQMLKLKDTLSAKLQEANEMDLFTNIEMPISEVLAKMQFNGMYLDKEELSSFGNELKEQISKLTNEIYSLAGEEFNINSTQQLGVILFEKLGLKSSKKTKKGYSTDVDALEKIKYDHPIVRKIIEYRTLMKLNSTYVEGMLPYVNSKTGRIHSYFHQTVTATGRISSTEPNLQNIPTRYELGKKLRKVFKPQEGYVFIDADYSQIELRVLAHISQDAHMIEAFKNGEDIHKQAASKVLGIPIEKVTKEQRSAAKAVNFGIVYGISDFGLSEQLGVSVKKAKEYINQYLEKYSGIQKFMNDVVEKAKQQGYVETLFHRRRYLPELKSSNYMVREFGKRAAMNTPIQGTAADIMKIAMVNLNKELEKSKIDAKIVLQVHDELILETKEEDKEKAKEILKSCMESAISLSIPLEVEVSEATNWYDCK